MLKNNIDTLQYSGYVNITTTKSKSKIKNKGTTTLFSLFARLLAGYIVNSAELPKTIMLYSMSSIDSGVRYPALNQEIVVSSAYRMIKSHPCAVFTGAISDTNLQNLDVEATYVLELHDGTINQTKLAEIQVDINILRQVQSGRQALIEWVMQVNQPSNAM